MRRTLMTVGLVVALMGLSISALADDHENGDEPDDELALQAEAGFLVSIEFGEVTFEDDLLTIDEGAFDFGDLEETHGHYVAAAVELFKTFDDEGAPEIGDYRLGCLVKQAAQTDLGKEEGTDELPFEVNYSNCLKRKAAGDDWTPPGWEKRGPNWTPPGWENKPDNDS